MKRFVVLILFILICRGVYAENYHVLSVSPNGRNATVVFHIPIADTNNAVAYSYNTALSEYVGGVGFVSQVPWGLAALEQADLENGVLFEHVESINFLNVDTDGQKQAKIDDRFTALSVSILARVRAILKFWHLNRDVP